MNLTDPPATRADLAAAFRRQCEARDRGPTPDASMRRATLEALAAMLHANADALCTAIDRDFHGHGARFERLLKLVSR